MCHGLQMEPLGACPFSHTAAGVDPQGDDPTATFTLPGFQNAALFVSRLEKFIYEIGM